MFYSYFIHQGDQVKRIVMDEKFYSKRRNNSKIKEFREGTFAISKEEEALQGDAKEVEDFAPKKDESQAKEEVSSGPTARILSDLTQLQSVQRKKISIKTIQAFI